MTALVIREFKGEVPRLPADQLPDGYAQQAINCDFTNKVLAPRRGGLLVTTMVNTPVRSLYTDDGLNFYTWTHETNAFKSPVINEAYNRMYFLDAAGTLSVAAIPTSQLTGGPPAESFKVGVPSPAAAPGLSVVNRTTMPDYPSATISFAAWYETGGNQSSKAAVTGNEEVAFQSYTFIPPARGSAPAESPLRVEVKVVDGTKTLFTVTSGDSVGNRSSAVPGSVECSLEKVNDTTYRVKLDWGIFETRAYVYTCVNTWQEESGPSPAALVSLNYMQAVRINAPVPSFTGYRPFLKVKIYHTFGASPDYLSIDATSEGSDNYLDTSHVPGSAGTILSSTFWRLPPSSGCHSLNLAPNGWFVVAKDNVLYACVPYRPNTWPYDLSFSTNIRGVRPMAQGILVTTADACYLVNGAHPAGWQAMKLPVPQAGISNRSMTEMDGAAAFASNDGLVTVEGSQASLQASQSLFDRAKWRERYAGYLSDMMLGYHDGDLVALTRTAAVGFVVKIDDEVKGYTQLPLQADAMFRLQILDTLYYTVGANLYRFGDSAVVLDADWWSKDFVFPKPVNFGAGYIRCDGPVTMSLYANGSLYYSTTLASTGYFRLPSGLSQMRWSVRLQTQYTVNEFVIAQTLEELSRV